MMNEEEIIRLCQALGDTDKFDQLAKASVLPEDILNAMADANARVKKLRKEADTDFLTGAWNRRYFFRRVDEILSKAAEADVEEFRAAMLIYDLDDFKIYNDEFGHYVGDEILCDTAKLIVSMCRQQDIVARVGGDEFAVLLWDYKPRQIDSEPLRNAIELADRFREAITTLKPESLGQDAQGSLTISGGLAIWPANGSDCKTLLHEADLALLRAKKTGKNTIIIVGQ